VAQRNSSALRAQLANKANLFDRLAPGQRPDTLVLYQLPYRWVGVAQLNTVFEGPTDELTELLQRACQWSSSDASAAIRFRIDSGSDLCSIMPVQFKTFQESRGHSEFQRFHRQRRVHSIQHTLADQLRSRCTEWPTFEIGMPFSTFNQVL
jgi:hypothetical protein